MIKKLLKKISCKIFFCVSSKCSYNENGKGKIKINYNDNEIIESDKTSK
jgi:hypothetical protein